MYEFRLPDVGEGIHEAELVEWNVAVGDVVNEGDTVATVNTDKVSVELPAPVTGVVAALPWEPGDVVVVGSVLLTFQIDGGVGTSRENTTAGVSHEPSSAAPVASAERRSSGGHPPTRSLSEALGRVIAAPSTRRLAAELGVDLADVVGSGPGGRVLRRDIEGSGIDSISAAVADSVPPDDGAVTREPLTGARAVLWRHMAESSDQLATTTSTFTVRMEAAEEVLDDLRSDDPGERRIGVLALASACVVRALTRHPRFNATVDSATDELLVHRSVHLGVAVASPGGLVVPVVRDADSMRLDDLSRAIGDVADRARRAALGVDDMRGGTFSLSSTGGLERARVTSTQPIVNLPQVALLWMSRIRDEPVVDAGEVRPGRVMTCSLSFDHRYLDGADATSFINEVTDLVEHPVRALA